jgi:1-phosphofructokinase family hexose kinase
MIFTITLNPVIDRTLTIPEIRFNDVIHARPAQLDWGGKGFNVSRALKVLGMESVALGFLGGVTGKQIQDGLNKLGIQNDFTWISGTTRTNVVILEENSGKHIKVNEPGPTIFSDEIDKFYNKLLDYLGDGDTWVLSGSLPLGVNSGIYRDLISLIQSKGSKAVLDTSGEMLRLGLEASPYLIKPNRIEAEQVCEFPLSVKDDLLKAVDFFKKKGVELIAISLGAEGLFFAWDTGVEWVKPPPIRAGNPTGAGDALLAGILYSLVNKLSYPDVTRWAVACGSAAAQGAEVGLANREAVTNLFYWLNNQPHN